MIAERLEVIAKRDFQKLFFAAGKRIYLSSLIGFLKNKFIEVAVRNEGKY